MTKTALWTLITLAAFGGGEAKAATLIQLDGPGAPVPVGTLFRIDVAISGVSDLATYQFDLGYNPLLLSGVSVEEGGFLPSAGATLFVPGAIDDGAGLISFTAGTLVGVGPGATGGGVLATAWFRAVGTGTASISLLSPLAYDSIPNPVALQVTGTSVVIEESAIPEPASAVLAASALAVGLAIRRRA